MGAKVLTIALLFNLIAAAAGVWLGIWAGRRVPLTLDLPNANVTGIRLAMWSMRLFVFLMCFVAVTAPVVFLTGALLDAR